jgi:hypothetical protein
MRAKRFWMANINICFIQFKKFAIESAIDSWFRGIQPVMVLAAPDEWEFINYV